MFFSMLMEGDRGRKGRRKRGREGEAGRKGSLKLIVAEKS